MGIYIATQQRICAEGAAFAIVICVQNDQDIFDCYHHGKTPDNDGQHAHEVLVVGWGGKGRRIDVEGTGANVAIDDTD